MKKYQFKNGKEDLISTGGNYLCGLILEKVSTLIPKNFQKRRIDAISDRDILMSQISLLSNGRSDFNDIELYKNDVTFKDFFDIEKVPSEATLRNRLDEMPRTKTHKALLTSNIALIGDRTLSTIPVQGLDLIPVDIDVSPLDNSGSSKQGVSFTYKMHDGFAPMFAYIGTEGYMLNCELREGKQHCQKDTPAFLLQCIEQLKELNCEGKCLIRLDSGNDAEENFNCLGENYYIIKRNLRRESKEQWLAKARRLGVKKKTREGKNVYTGYVDHYHPGGNTNRSAVPIVFEVIERLTDDQGQAFVFPQIQVNTWWTNLACEASQVIDLYHQHGTSEQFHSELKSDMGVERLSSHRFCVNEIILLCSMIAFNTLRALGQLVIANKELAPIKTATKRWRLKSVIQNLIYCAIRVIRHAGKKKISYGRRCPWYNVINQINISLS